MRQLEMEFKMGHIGITGTQWGMTDAQKEVALYIYKKYLILYHGLILHQGMCKGADTEMHDLIREYDPYAQIIGHPSIKKDRQVWRQCDQYREPKEFLERNRDIVSEVDVMIATPFQEEEQQRGGTWYTIRQAKKAIKAGKKCQRLIVIKPSGKVDYFDFDKLNDK